MILKSINATNFLSFRELSYNFQSHPILIQGENLTDESQESNGSGKSALQAAIEYCLFKTTSKKVRDNELIHFGQEESELKLVIECPIRRELLVIQRKIKLKGSSSVSLFIVKDGSKALLETATVNDANKQIIDWIGISADDLQNYFIINKERYRSFFSSSNREKIEMINRFSNAKLINGVDVQVKNKVSELETELSKLNDSKVSTTATIKSYHNQIKSELSRDIQNEIRQEVVEQQQLIEAIEFKIEANKSKIKNLKKDILDKKDLIDFNEKEVLELGSRLREVQPKLEEVDVLVKALEKKYENSDNQISLLSDRQRQVDEKRQSLLKDKRELELILSDIEKNLSGTIQCPKCSHKFILADPNLDVHEEEVAKKDTEDLVGLTKISIDSVSNEFDKFQIQLTEVKREKANLRVEEVSIDEKRKLIEAQVRQINTQITNIKSRIQLIKNEEIIEVEGKIKRLLIDNDSALQQIDNINKHIEQILLKTIDQKRIEEWRKQLVSLGKELRLINDDIKAKKVEIFNTTQWIFNFKKFNMYLANHSLKIIQGYCNKFLQDVKSDIQIRWEGIKMLANGDLREEITPYIIRDNEQRDFWSYSGGERARLDYSMIFTLQEMINKTNKWSGLQFTSLDEVMESIDSVGLCDLMNSINKLKRSVLITTHVVNRNIHDNVLLIRKENGISTIVN